MSNQESTRAGNIREFKIFQPKKGGGFVDASAAVTDLEYYEDVLSNSIHLSVIIAETGESDSAALGNKGMLDGLPLRGGNKAHIVILDHDDNELSFKGDKALYVNRVSNVLPGTQKDVYRVDFCSREYLANEQCRVIRRYDGKITDSVEKILKEPTSKGAGIQTTKEIDMDETLINYNFIGNERKPFHVCTWLASKSVPEEAGKLGGTAGYFFFETYDGYKFKSIDYLIKQESKGKYIFTNTADMPKSGQYTGKILDYTIDRDVDLQSNLSIGLYANRTIFFDFYASNYKVRNFSINESGAAENDQGAGSLNKTETLGKEETYSIPDEIMLPVSRLMNRVLDVGVLPDGKTTEDQLEHWKNTPYDPTFDAAKIMVQSVMRYNRLFYIKINITIAGSFNLRAGDIISCEFPELTTNPNTPTNDESGGLYMIASLCHYLTPKETFTKLTLVRDTFGKKSS